jgi:hypothetical protein
MKKVTLGGARSTHGRNSKVIYNFGWRSEGKDIIDEILI